MPGRTYSAQTGYKYGFNGKENDNEIKGEGNQIDYGMRIYDPRLGRFLSVDPLTNNFPWYTPYQFAGNTPIQAIDLDGEEEKHYTLTLNKDGTTILKQTSIKEFNEVPLWLRVFTLGLGPKKAKISERAVVTYENKNYYIGFAGSKGRGNENGMALFKEFEKDPIAPLFPMMFLNEDQSYSVEYFSMAVNFQNNTAMYGSLTEKAWYSRIGVKTVLGKSDRLKIFTARLKEAAPVSNQKEALNLINTTLDAVEDQYSGVLKAKGIPNRDDGRMYGILDEKYVTTLKDGTKVANTKGNRIVLNKDGGFEIQSKDGKQVLFSKPGKK
jgi:RHS repeat-associated protein